MKLTLRPVVIMLVCLGVRVASAAPDAWFTLNSCFDTNCGGNTVLRIDTATNTVKAVVTLPNNPGPWGVAVNPAGTIVYVTDRSTNKVSEINTADNTVGTPVSVGTDPVGVAVNPAGTRVYVTNHGSDSVSVIDTTTDPDTIAATIPLEAGCGPEGVAVNVTSTNVLRVYVACNNTNKVWVINPTTNAVIAGITVGTFPRGVAARPNGDKVYVTNYDDATVSVIKTSNNTVSATLSVVVSPIAVVASLDGTQVFVTAEEGDLGGNLSIITVADNSVVSCNVADWLKGIDVNPSNTTGFVSGSNPFSGFFFQSFDTESCAANYTSILGIPIAFGRFLAPEYSPPVPYTSAAERACLNAISSDTTAATTAGARGYEISLMDQFVTCFTRLYLDWSTNPNPSKGIVTAATVCWSGLNPDGSTVATALANARSNITSKCSGVTLQNIGSPCGKTNLSEMVDCVLAQARQEALTVIHTQYGPPPTPGQDGQACKLAKAVGLEHRYSELCP